ncbi:MULTISPECIES: alpha/beta fold hydrolase [Dactylosporangium]|uniref:Alpha/beta hydrolase n=2 Tax=Dactylosporangium TaxID=35753 RepID=A0A9W6KLR8_9ACTN|nr:MULTISPECIES: alpha/beta hydrolase [Dactylosporangium]UAB94300.1 alpha/beta hydrolase [Dactylosporangium vinaceum]UWZ42699.1 alpha/beta hydrolase [Dactylosporangium matsuzakiense]GLL03818.1 alpha/beta hydrolase [Dactylosporangium matsuzakiense]
MFKFLDLGSGRSIAYEDSGKPEGRPVFLHHGTPGSGDGPKPRHSILYRLGVRLIAYCRPGYGGSSRHAGRTVAEAAADVGALADALGLDTFAVLGRSGGGPHALACAALLPDRVTRAAALVSLAPADAVGLDWYGDMVPSNQRSWRAAALDEDLIAEQLRLRANRVRDDPAHLLRLLREEMPAADLRVVDDVAIERLLLRTYAAALGDGPYGWIDDLLALRGDWGFRLDGIVAPVRLWHGSDDRFAPVSHTRWLADNIPHAQLEVEHGAAHFGALRVMPRIIQWLAEV